MAFGTHKTCIFTIDITNTLVIMPLGGYIHGLLKARSEGPLAIGGGHWIPLGVIPLSGTKSIDHGPSTAVVHGGPLEIAMDINVHWTPVNSVPVPTGFTDRRWKLW